MVTYLRDMCQESYIKISRPGAPEIKRTGAPEIERTGAPEIESFKEVVDYVCSILVRNTKLYMYDRTLQASCSHKEMLATKV